MRKYQSQRRMRRMIERACAKVGLKVKGLNVGHIPENYDDVLHEIEILADNMRALGLVESGLLCSSCDQPILLVEFEMTNEKPSD